MIFTNREKETLELENAFDLSKRKIFTTLITGPRRIGKTELTKHFAGNKKYLYFFIYEGKTRESILGEFESELKEKKIIEEGLKIKNIESFIDIIFNNCKGYIIIFDEVQFMANIYRPFFSILQKKIDENQNFQMQLIFLGSIIGLIKNVFEDLKAPLYGRIKSHIHLKQLLYKDTKYMLKLLNYKNEDDFAKFYFVLGGFPKYYVAIEDYNLGGKQFFEVIEFLFFRENAPLGDEVQSILRQEFGSRKGYYYDILEAIATGHTKLNEICSYVKKTQTGITPFLNDLIVHYEIVSKEVPITENPKKSRNSIYLIKNPLFNFWFRFIYPNLRHFEKGDYSILIKKIKENANSFFGRQFEDLCEQVLKTILKSKLIPQEFNLIGKWWHKDKEIDIVALNEDKKEILFAECKWQERVNAGKLLKELKEKAKFVEWNNEGRKEYYCVFAKSFKEKIKEKNIYLFDLKDLEKAIK